MVHYSMKVKIITLLFNIVSNIWYLLPYLGLRHFINSGWMCLFIYWFINTHLSDHPKCYLKLPCQSTKHREMMWLIINVWNCWARRSVPLDLIRIGAFIVSWLSTFTFCFLYSFIHLSEQMDTWGWETEASKHWLRLCQWQDFHDFKEESEYFKPSSWWDFFKTFLTGN